MALVLAGGGARGAYEIGALSALLPVLADDERPQIIIGTSVGAINAAHLAAHADESPKQIVDSGIELWGQIGYGSVLKPLVSLSEGTRLWSYLREVLGSRRAHTNSLLDPTPLTATLGRLIAFDRIRANVAARHLQTAAVVATSGRTNMSVVFHDGGRSPAVDTRRGISYVQDELSEDHVRASAAIPLVFPAVPIDRQDGRRWYFDGGTRLNAPIKPALALGAERAIVIALNSLKPMPEREIDPRPDALDGATQLIQAVLVDPLVNDVHTLATVNELLEDGTEAKAQAHERRTGRRRVPYMLIAPEDPLEIGRIASEVYRECYSSPRALLRSPNVSGLGHLVNASSHGELLSYLLFAEEFIERLIDLGRRDAERWLSETHDLGRWQLGRL
ncbi:MAG TPA: patatin-like phospholipase family protein [Solirubrobacteraceae bacterium]